MRWDSKTSTIRFGCKILGGTFPFFKLPREMRSYIYSNVLDEISRKGVYLDSTSLHYEDWRGPHLFQLISGWNQHVIRANIFDMLLVSKQFSAEIAPFVYACPFHIPERWENGNLNLLCQRFLRGIGPGNGRSLRHLHLHSLCLDADVSCCDDLFRVLAESAPGLRTLELKFILLEFYRSNDELIASVIDFFTVAVHGVSRPREGVVEWFRMVSQARGKIMAGMDVLSVRLHGLGNIKDHDIRLIEAGVKVKLESLLQEELENPHGQKVVSEEGFDDKENDGET